MTEPKKLSNRDISDFIKDIAEKIDKFASILEKFGMDIITKMGQTNLKVNILTDKIDELSKATLDIKSLSPHLNNIIENQKILVEELDLIRSLIQRSDISFHSREDSSDEIQRDTSATDKKQSIIEKFNILVNYIEENDDPEPVVERLNNIKEDIFVFTGGHRILYEIGQFINKINSFNIVPDEEKANLKEKINFWINKLSVKG